MKLLRKLPLAETTADMMHREEEWKERRKAEDTKSEDEKYEARLILHRKAVASRVTALFLAFLWPLCLYSSPSTAIPEAAVFFAGTIHLVFFHSRYERQLKDMEKKPDPGRIIIYTLLTAFSGLVLVASIPDAFGGNDYLSSTLIYGYSIALLTLFELFLFVILMLRPVLLLLNPAGRRIRCTSKCRAKLRGFSAVGTDLPPEADPSVGGYPQYAYECSGREYVISYQSDRSGKVEHGMELDLRADPDYPHYFYDSSNAVKLIVGCIVRMVIGAVVLPIFSPGVIVCLYYIRPFFEHTELSLWR